MSDTADDEANLEALYDIALHDEARRHEKLLMGPPMVGKSNPTLQLRSGRSNAVEAAPSECSSASEAATITQVGLGPNHVVVTLSGPGRVEVSVVDGRLLLFAYAGTETDVEQDPDAVYDSARAQGPTMTTEQDMKRHHEKPLPGGQDDPDDAGELAAGRAPAAPAAGALSQGHDEKAEMTQSEHETGVVVYLDPSEHPHPEQARAHLAPQSDAARQDWAETYLVRTESADQVIERLRPRAEALRETLSGQESDAHREKHIVLDEWWDLTAARERSRALIDQLYRESRSRRPVGLVQRPEDLMVTQKPEHFAPISSAFLVPPLGVRQQDIGAIADQAHSDQHQQPTSDVRATPLVGQEPREHLVDQQPEQSDADSDAGA